jgi:hypothetical protein
MKNDNFLHTKEELQVPRTYYTGRCTLDIRLQNLIKNIPYKKDKYYIGKFVVLTEYPYLRDYVYDYPNGEEKIKKLDAFIQFNIGQITKLDNRSCFTHDDSYFVKYENLIGFKGFFTKNKEVSADLSQLCFIGSYEECELYLKNK